MIPQLSPAAQRLMNMICEKPFDAARVQAELQSWNGSTADLSAVAFEYIDHCHEDTRDLMEWPINWPELLPDSASVHLCEILALFIDHGMDPNLPDADGCLLLGNLRFLRNGYAAADAAALLLEHGADPNLPDDECNLIRNVNTDVGFDLLNQEVRFRFDALVHYWLVLLGYGAKLEDGSVPLDLIRGFDPAMLKDHRNYYVGAIDSKGENYSYELCIFDRHTNWEVARF